MKSKLSVLLTLLLGLNVFLFAQKNKPKTGREIKFTITHAVDSVVYLASHYKDKIIVMDSARVVTPGVFIFSAADTLKDGLYMLVSQAHKPYVSFIIDRNQHFSIKGDTSGTLSKIEIQNSPENLRLLEFSKKSSEANTTLKAYREKYAEFEKAERKDSMEFYKEKSKNLTETMNRYVDGIIENEGHTLFGKMQRAYKEIDIPQNTENAEDDNSFIIYYYRTHFWDNIDLKEDRLIYTPVLYPKLTDYFDRVLQYADADTITHYINLLLNKVDPNSELFRYFLDYLTYHYETSKILGHDAVFVNIAKTYQLQGKCTWLDSVIVEKYANKIRKMEPTLIGEKAPLLLMPDTAMSPHIKDWHSNYDFERDFEIMWFFDPDCGTCKKETKKLIELYNERAKGLGINVYAVCIDNDIDRWKRYIIEHKFPFLCVGGNTANIDFKEVYNIIGTPAMFILDKNRKIILNKRVDIEQIPEFLEQHRRIEEAKKKN